MITFLFRRLRRLHRLIDRWIVSDIHENQLPFLRFTWRCKMASEARRLDETLRARRIALDRALANVAKVREKRGP